MMPLCDTADSCVDLFMCLYREIGHLRDFSFLWIQTVFSPKKTNLIFDFFHVPVQNYPLFKKLYFWQILKNYFQHTMGYRGVFLYINDKH